MIYGQNKGLITPCIIIELKVIKIHLYIINTSAEWHIYVSKLETIIGSDNGLLPVRRQAIIWTNASLSLTGLLGINFGEIWIKIIQLSLKNYFENVCKIVAKSFLCSLIK